MKPDFGPDRVLRPTNISAPSPTSPFIPYNQHILPLYQNKVTRAQIISNNTTMYTPLLCNCDMSIILPLHRTLHIIDDTLLGLKNFMTILSCL